MTMQTTPASTGLVWGIKRSFTDYISGMIDSKSSAVKGAGVNQDGRFYFPPASSEDYDRHTGLGTIEFGGDVRFSAHHGMLFVIIAKPSVTFTEDAALLSIADPDSYPALDRRLALLDLTRSEWADHDGVRMWRPLRSTLRADGVPFFNDVYPAGEPFDPVELRVAI